MLIKASFRKIRYIRATGSFVGDFTLCKRTKMVAVHIFSFNLNCFQNDVRSQSSNERCQRC